LSPVLSAWFKEDNVDICRRWSDLVKKQQIHQISGTEKVNWFFANLTMLNCKIRYVITSRLKKLKQEEPGERKNIEDLLNRYTNDFQEGAENGFLEFFAGFINSKSASEINAWLNPTLSSWFNLQSPDDDKNLCILWIANIKEEQTRQMSGIEKCNWFFANLPMFNSSLRNVITTRLKKIKFSRA